MEFLLLFRVCNKIFESFKVELNKFFFLLSASNRPKHFNLVNTKKVNFIFKNASS